MQPRPALPCDDTPPAQGDRQNDVRLHTPKPRQERSLAACEAVLDLAAALFNVSGKELRRPGRTGLDVARVRQVAMYAAHVTLSMSMREIGQGFGRDRTTVLHACQVIEDLRDDLEFDAMVTTFERVLRASFAHQFEEGERR